jgi:hypothetical protein
VLACVTLVAISLNSAIIMAFCIWLSVGSNGGLVGGEVYVEKHK